MTVVVDVTNAAPNSHAPKKVMLKKWVAAALNGRTHGEVSIRIVDEAESAALNQQYRGKTGATNVLSFPADIPAVVQSPLLGDLVICADVVAHEARTQHKTLEAHWAHIVIHGVLHLLGHDHIKDDEAEKMEAIEINLLKQLGYDNPYFQQDE